MRLRDALLLLMVLVLLVGILPVGLLLHRRLDSALVDRERHELTAAPMILEDRLASVRTVRMMHARDFSAMPELVEAMETGDMERASRLLSDASRDVQESPVLVAADQTEVLGPGGIPDHLIEATRNGEMPVAVVPSVDGLHLLALAPVTSAGRWIGAVGGSTPFADAEAATLAGLTRSEIIILDPEGRVTAGTVPRERAEEVARLVDGSTGEMHDLTLPSGGVLATTVQLDHGRVVFFKDLAQELTIVPDLQRTALISATGALMFAILVGAIFARRLARPVSELADAATKFGSSGSEIPLRRSSLLEVRRLSDAFTAMRRALAARLKDLERANQELEERQIHLAAMQAELVQRERLATSGRVIAQLAHEIRNPVASVRNCLEVVKRQGELEGEAAEFADMAVDELLRMHELAENMLDLHRPRSDECTTSDVGQVARETVQLLRAGSPDPIAIEVEAPEGLEADIRREALKQVLMNLLLNACEAAPPGSTVKVMVARVSEAERDGEGDTGGRGEGTDHGGSGEVRIDVLDRGPGIPSEVMDRIFDPFFTTKTSVHGVGLGLYTAESLVRGQGGRLEAVNRSDGPGAHFTVVLPGVTS